MPRTSPKRRRRRTCRPIKSDTDVAIIDKAATLAVEAAKFSKLEKQFDAAKLAAESAAKELAAAIGPLQQKAEATNRSWLEIDGQLKESRQAVNSLKGLFQSHPELLSRDDAPVCIREQWKQEGKEAESIAVRSAAMGAVQSANVASMSLRGASKACGIPPRSAPRWAWSIPMQPRGICLFAIARTEAALEAAKIELDDAKEAARKTGMVVR